MTNQIQITGADLSGSSGSTSRTYQLPDTDILSGYLQIWADRQFLHEGASNDFTESSGLITFNVAVWNDQNIKISYSLDSESSSTSTTSDDYATTLELARFMQIEGVIPDRTIVGADRSRETVGTGDNSTTEFFTYYSGVLSSSYTFSYGATEASRTNLVETTDYTLDKDLGKLTLTSTGVTTVGTNNIYGEYSYVSTGGVPGLTDTQLQNAINRAVSDIEETTGTKWVDGSVSTPTWGIISKEEKKGRGKYRRDYYLNHYRVAELITTLNGDLTDSATTITVEDTDGFPSSGTIVIENEKITYTGKTNTTFTGCTRGVDDSTAGSHDDDTEVIGWCIEVSTTCSGSAPTWQVFKKDTDYDLDIDTGRVHLYKTDILLDEFSYHSPPFETPNRVRITYPYGYTTIPTEINGLTLRIAAKDLIEGNVANAHVSGLDGFNPSLVNVYDKYIETNLAKNINHKSSNT